jgi:glycosyltransferase involved in cell wall biosynthesis
MHAEADPRLGFQPDIYQRYGFLARLVEAVLGTPRDLASTETSQPPHYRLLDVGSGPVRLVEAFLPAWIEVVRTDVTTFGDSSIIQMAPDGSLPFPDGAFDIVLAMDVLEHVPASQRPSLIAECQRVAGRSLIIGGPVRSAEVVAAERAFAELARTVSGQELEFLAEHARFGLPERGDIIDALADRAWHVVTVENSPLAEWQVFNAIDLLYAADLGDGEPKRATNALINSRSVFRRESGPHYRSFVCAFKDEADAAAARTLAASAAIVGPPLSPLELAAESTALLPRLQLDLRSARTVLERVVGEKDAHIAGIGHELSVAIAGKDAHIDKLTNVVKQLSDDVHDVNKRLAELQRAAVEKDAALAAAAQEAAALQTRNRDLDRTLRAQEELTAALDRQVKALQGLSKQRLMDVRRVEQDLAVRAGVADQLAREVEALRATLASIQSSLAWKVARPVRAMDRTVRFLRRTAAGSPQTAPASPAPEPSTDQHQFEYSVLSPSPLFDRQWYRSRTPEVAEAVDPVVHYLTTGRTNGLNPHPLFDSAFYLERNPDVGAAGIDPLVHYITAGALEGRHPHPLFDSTFYLAENADVAAAGLDPLAHYITHGAAEGRRPHPLFDVGFYLAQGPDVTTTGLDPLTHYVTRGAREGLDPHPLFDTTFYLEQNPGVAAAGINPLAHFVVSGARDGRNPHPLFDTSFYLERNPDVAAAGINPLVHFITSGAREARDPHPLFDSSFYLEQNPDVAAAGINPLGHFVTNGASEGRDPHPLFDISFYLEQNPDVAAAGLNPLLHYLTFGGREGRNPHPSFDTSFYLEENPDVAAAGLNPLVHYLTCGAREGRRPTRPTHVVHGDTRYVPPEGLLPWFNPLTIAASDALSSSPRLNVLLPGLAMKHMSGGPNTAIALACALAARGVSIRFMSTDAAIDADSAPFWEHVRTLTRVDRLPSNMELVDAHDRSHTTHVGANDLFMATAWWTAQQAKYATRVTHQQTFLYLIQDYEPLLHAASTQYALASETYELPHLPIINTSLLHEFLASQKIGRFRDEAFARSALIFEPALDQAIFHPREMPGSDSRRRLLFYARPTNGLRNLFELGVAALQKVVGDGVLDPASWDFVGMGEAFAPVSLGRGAVLRPAEWVDLERYARQMRESDILLSLMLSPHPSYPPLEMAASGGVSVTTTFGTKTAERLSQLSPNIVGVEPTIESIADGLAEAVRRLPRRDQRQRDAHLALPQSWADSFEPILPRLMDELALLQGSPLLPAHAASTTSTPSKVFPGFEGWAANEYDVHRRSSVLARQGTYPNPEPGLISFLTPLWNTDPAQFEALAATVIGQDAGTDFEWIVLDNGSTRAETRSCLAQLAQHPAVRLHRSDKNLGIIAGTRFCLESASNRYVVPLDHDDLLTPDAARVLTHALRRAGYPPFAYSDEDKLEGGSSRDPYFKPDWDPVLFVNSCYTSHLCAIDRQLALELGAYTDQAAEGSPDWDTFTRLYVAGHVPLHIPEVLYTWRMHAESTAGNIQSKPYVYASQRRVLSRVLAAAPDPSLYELQPSPLFAGMPDWWIRRAHRNPWRVTTVVVAAHEAEVPGDLLRSDFPHEVIRIHPSDGLRRLQGIAARSADSGRLVHLLWSDTKIEEQEWPWEAMAHFELFPDTVMIGGRVHDGRRIRAAGCYFGFGKGCDSPDRGRALADPGYFAQMWKQHSVSAVSVQHCVVRPQFLGEALELLSKSGVSLAGLGPWLGAAARQDGRRVVYSPFFCASTGLDLDAEVTDVERGAFRSAHRDLIPDVRYLSRSLGLSPSTAYRPVPEEVRGVELEAAARLPSYADWTAAEAIARSVKYACTTSDPAFSLLTTLYSGTQADLLRETARSLFEQTHPFAEWVILIHGPVTPAVESVVADCAADARVHVLRRDENVGIVKGLGLCLQQASSAYVVPMDADDLLAPDALQVLASEIRASRPVLIYTDEDTYCDGAADSPFFRPDFDRVLNAESSYVWHLCAYRRDEALRLGVYEDAGAEFCHDWDTICRFARAGGQIAHANHVLYHWRAHPGSHSNSGGQHPGSLASTKFILNRTIGEQADPSLYRVVPFPIFRGAEEWCIERLQVNPPPVDAVVLGESRAFAAVQRCVFPFRAIHHDEADAAGGLSDRLRHALDSGSEYVLVVGDECEDLEQSGIWEAVKLLEMHPDVAVVSGRLVNDAGVVVSCGSVPDRFGRLVSPFAGLEHTDPGPFAMALKGHCIRCPAEGLFVARSAFLARAMEARPTALELPIWLGACAVSQLATIAYSPRLQGRTRAPARNPPEGSGRELSRFLEDLGISIAERSPEVIGIAGFLNARREIGGGSPAGPAPRHDERGERLEPVRG